MTHSTKLPLFVLGLALTGLMAAPANAQTAAVTATVDVLNSLTLTTVNNLNFGRVAAVGDTGNTAAVVVSSAGVDSVSSTGGAAVTAMIDNSAVSAAQITVADGADGATLNIDIQNVVDPTDGTDTFTLAGFSTSWNGGAPAAQTAGTPWTETFDAATGPNLNTLDIGASITTIDPSGVYGDGVYNGGFDVVFSY